MTTSSLSHENTRTYQSSLQLRWLLPLQPFMPHPDMPSPRYLLLLTASHVPFTMITTSSAVLIGCQFSSSILLLLIVPFLPSSVLFQGIPNEPRPLLADLPDKLAHPLLHGSSKTKLPAQSLSLPKPKTAVKTQQKRQSLPLLKPKAMSQPRSTSAVYLVRPDSPSHSPKGMQVAPAA